ncbi:MAG TPA: response regulator [Ktedonobacterales bacterium]|nr:response regulator [Ktedonobacterales bacterium]
MTRVLLVDDDQAIRETLRFVLEDAGYQVLEASDGSAALRALRDAPKAWSSCST